MCNFIILILLIFICTCTGIGFNGSDETTAAVSAVKAQSVKKQLNDSHIQQGSNESLHPNPFWEDDKTSLPDSLEYFFYCIIAVSVFALLVILVKVYRFVYFNPRRPRLIENLHPD